MKSVSERLFQVGDVAIIQLKFITEGGNMSPYAETVLNKLRELQARPDRPVRAGLIAELLGSKRRTVYNYLIELEARGLVAKASPKRWCVA